MKRNPEIVAKVVALVIASAGELRDGEVDEASEFEKLGMDSLDKIEVVMATETEYNIEISDDEAEKLNGVGDLADLVDRKVTL